MDPDILFVSTLPRPAATHRIFNLVLPVALLAPLLAPLRAAAAWPASATAARKTRSERRIYTRLTSHHTFD